MVVSADQIERYLNIVSPYVYPTVATFVVFLCAVASWLVFYRWRNRSHPPGPPGLPFLGYLPFLKNDLSAFSQLSDTYGDILHLKLGSNDAVVLGSFDAVKKAFVDQPDVFSGRGDVYMMRNLWNNDKGILMSEGEKWRTLRNFAINALKPEDLLHAVQREAVEMISVLKVEHGKPVDSRKFITQAVGNVACSWILGKRMPYTDSLYQSYIENFQVVADQMHHTTFDTFIPSLNPLSSRTNKMQQLEENFKEKIGYIREMIKNSVSEESSNFALSFLARGRAGGTSEENQTWFTEDELVMMVNDIWGAATETVTSTLQWAIYYMLQHPKIQAQVQAELDEKTGIPEHNMVTIDAKDELPFTLATLQEIERCASVAPFGVLRCNVEETQLENYTIPSRSLIIPNLWRIHHDERNWERPDDFSPERFLTAKGGVTRPPFLIPYSIGARSCPFQTAAASEIFLIFANLLRCFKLELPVGATLPSPKEKIFALTVRPKDFSFMATPRFSQLLPNVLESQAAG